jgi:hypothetical protein
MTAEKAIEILSDVGDINRCCAEDAEALDMAIKALEQTRWIPCAERLPEKDGYYLVTTKWKSRYLGNVYIDATMARYREKPKEWTYNHVIAWMPLPEPYKAESEGEA